MAAGDRAGNEDQRHLTMAHLDTPMCGRRFTAMSIIEPENPYWNTNSITFEDPDGWRVVLVGCAGFTD
jgi:hypothetical protein